MSGTVYGKENNVPLMIIVRTKTGLPGPVLSFKQALLWPVTGNRGVYVHVLYK